MDVPLVNPLKIKNDEVNKNKIPNKQINFAN